jgi:hypothetical protein
MSDRIYLFRAVKGRVYHASDTPIEIHGRPEGVIAICGASFQYWYPWEHSGDPTCPRCRKILDARKAEHE